MLAGPPYTADPVCDICKIRISCRANLSFANKTILGHCLWLQGHLYFVDDFLLQLIILQLLLLLTMIFAGLLLKDQLGFLFPYTVYAEPYLGLDAYYDEGTGPSGPSGPQTYIDYNSYGTG